jgi:hypothetical protein
VRVAHDAVIVASARSSPGSPPSLKLRRALELVALPKPLAKAGPGDPVSQRQQRLSRWPAAYWIARLRGATTVEKDTERMSKRSPSRGTILPALCQTIVPPNRRGRRECLVKASPAAPVHNKKHGEGTTGSAESSGIPCAVSFARSLGTGLCCPIAARIVSAQLGLSVGRPEPHDFAVRVGHARLARPTRPSHHAPRS